MRRRMRMRMRTVGRVALLAGLALGLSGAPAQGLPLSFALGASEVVPGEAVDLTISIGGLGDGTAPSLRAYTIKVAFDPALLAFDDVVFGTALGTPCPPGDSDPSCQATADSSLEDGEITLLTETSLLDDLSAQAGSFELATASFLGLGPAGGPTATSLALVTDAFTELVLTDNQDPETLTLAPFDTPLPESSLVVLPEPGTAALVALGLAALGGRRRAVG